MFRHDAAMGFFCNPPFFHGTAPPRGGGEAGGRRSGKEGGALGGEGEAARDEGAACCGKRVERYTWRWSAEEVELTPICFSNFFFRQRERQLAEEDDVRRKRLRALGQVGCGH